MNLKRSRGLTLLMSCLINLCIGSAYSWSVFAGPLAERLTALGGAAYSASDLGIVFTVYNIPGPFCMTAGGWLNRRIEVRRLIQMGSVLFVAAVVQQGNHSGRPGRGLWTAGGGWRGDGVRLYGE